MPEPSSPSVETISEQDYISKTVAITLLQELLKEVVIDGEVKNTLLEQFNQTLEESFQNPEWVQELSLTVEEVEEESSLEEVEPSWPYTLEIRLLRCHLHSIHCPPRLGSVSPMPGPQFGSPGPQFGSSGSMMDSIDSPPAPHPIHQPPSHHIHQPPLGPNPTP